MNTHTQIVLPACRPHDDRRPERRGRALVNAQALRGIKARVGGRVPLLLFLAAAAFSLTPYATPGIALAVGTGLALTSSNPFPALSRKLAKNLLQLSIILLGFSMNLVTALAAGRDGLLFAAATILATFALAHFLARRLRIAPKTSTLIAAGSAICGGSAIAAVGAVIDAAESDMSVAMATIFLLNAAALYLFPPLGHALGLSQVQFGTWAGIAIHDVSSVVGAASRFGLPALQTATAVKLSRALWIVPVALVAAHRFRQPVPTGTTASTHDFHAEQPAGGKRKLHLPWFIAGFLAASLARTLFPPVAAMAPALTHGATVALTLTLFLIGAGISRSTLRTVGPRPMVQGLLLWIFIATSSLILIKLTLR